MDRRDFLKLASLAGVSVCSPFPARTAEETPELYDGSLFMFVRARGGWDQTMFIDPKGKMSSDESDPVDHYLAKDIRSAGTFEYAPNLSDYDQFFQDHHDKMVAVHGYNVANLAHSAAQRYTWTGSIRHTHPSIGALVAAAKGPGLPLAYLTSGGTTPTKGVVDQVRASELKTAREMNEYNTAEVRGRPNYYDDYEEKLLERAIKARMERRLEGPALPREKRDVARLQTVHVGHDLIKKKSAELPTASDLRQYDNPLKRQAVLIMSSYQAGITVSGTLYMKGFDSHTGNDSTQKQNLDQLLEGLEFILAEAQRRSIRDFYLVVMSDFGRSPSYNSGNGKGHYPIATMLAISPHLQGDREIGETTHRLKPKKIDPDTLEPDSGGIQLRPEHIHSSLRRLAGIDSHPLTDKYSLPDDSISNLFA